MLPLTFSISGQYWLQFNPTPKRTPMDTQQLQTQRADRFSSQIVERGIKVQESFSTLCAVEYMKSHNIHFDVIERVLLNPAQRRKIEH